MSGFFKRWMHGDADADQAGAPGELTGSGRGTPDEGAKILLPSAVPSVSRSGIFPGEHSASNDWNARHGQAERPEGGEDRKAWVSVADLLPRLPPEVIRRESVNPAQRLWFKISDLAAMVARRKQAMNVGEIAEICPELFGPEVYLEANTPVLFPWHRILHQVRALAPLGTPRETPKTPAQPRPPPRPAPDPPAPPEARSETPDALRARLDAALAQTVSLAAERDRREAEFAAEKDRLNQERAALAETVEELRAELARASMREARLQDHFDRFKRDAALQVESLMARTRAIAGKEEAGGRDG